MSNHNVKRYPTWPYDSFAQNLKYAWNEYIPGLRHKPILTIARTPDSRKRSEFWVFNTRWIIPLALIGRFILHNNENDGFFFSLSLAKTFWTLWLILVGYMALTSVCKYVFLQNRLKTTNTKRFIWWVIVFDCIFISMFFILSKELRSGLPLLYFIPLIIGFEYYPIRNNLLGLTAVAVTFALSVIIMMLCLHHGLNFREALLIIVPKLIAFIFVGFYMLWTLLHLGCLERLFMSTFDKSADGITIIEANIDGNGKLYPGQILRMNETQSLFAPNAVPNRKKCFFEFESHHYVHSEQTDPHCPWCPVVDVFREPHIHKRSITLSYIPRAPETKQLGYFDVSASAFLDESDKPSGAVEVVKEITTEVIFAMMANSLVRVVEESEVLRVVAKGLRDMFRAMKVVIYKIDIDQKIVRSLCTIDDGEDEAQLASLYQPVTLLDAAFDSLNNFPWEIDMLKACTEKVEGSPMPVEVSEKWKHWLIPPKDIDESKTSGIPLLAELLNIKYGMIGRVGSSGNIWGIVAIHANPQQPDLAMPFTRFDVIQCDLACSLLFVTLKALNAGKSAPERAQEPAEPRGVLDIFRYIAATKRDDEKIGLSMLAITANVGLGFTRAIYMELKGNHLIPKYGVGPVRDEETCLHWTPLKSSFAEYLGDDEWMEKIKNTSIGRTLKEVGDKIKIDTYELKESVVAKACREQGCYYGQSNDVFHNTTLSEILRFDKDFVASSVYSQGKCLGVIIADKQFSHSSITERDRDQFLYLSSLLGICLHAQSDGNFAVEITSESLSEYALDTLLTLAKARSTEVAKDMERIKRICCDAAVRLEWLKEEIDIVATASLAANFGTLAWSDRILFGKERISDDERELIKNHGNISASLMSVAGANKAVVEVVQRHHSGMNDATANDPKLDKIALLIEAAEVVCALRYPKPFREADPADYEAIRTEILREGIDLEIANALIESCICYDKTNTDKERKSSDDV